MHLDFELFQAKEYMYELSKTGGRHWTRLHADLISPELAEDGSNKPKRPTRKYKYNQYSVICFIIRVRFLD